MRNRGASEKNAATYVAVFLQNKPYLGNQIALVPLFDALRRENPDRRLLVCAHHQAANAISELGYVDVLLPGPGRPSGLLAMFQALRGYPIETAYLLRRHSMKTAFLARWAASRAVIGYDARTTNLWLTRRVPLDKSAYTAQLALALVEKALSAFSSDSGWCGGDYFLMIPGGSLPQKKYPIDRYIAIAERLTRKAPVHFLLGGDMTEEIQALSAEGDRFCLHINRPLSEVAALVRHSAVVIANDCGPVHFAHIYDVPRVIVYTAEASRDHWYRDSLRSIRLASDGSGGIYAVDPDAILAAAVSLYHDNCFE